MLKEQFIALVAKYSNDPQYIDTLWRAIEQKHTHKNRHYHTLTHLENIYTQIAPLQSVIIDWDIVMIALYYHDYVYNSLKKKQ